MIISSHCELKTTMTKTCPKEQKTPSQGLHPAHSASWSVPTGNLPHHHHQQHHPPHACWWAPPALSHLSEAFHIQMYHTGDRIQDDGALMRASLKKQQAFRQTGWSAKCWETTKTRNLWGSKADRLSPHLPNTNTLRVCRHMSLC